MKNKLIPFFLVTASAILMNGGCNSRNQSITGVNGKDTLFVTIIKHPQQRQISLYRYISQKTINNFDTLYSEEGPPTTTMSKFGTLDCGYIPIQPVFGIIIKIPDTLYRLIENPASHDTISIWNTIDSSNIITYKDTINCFIDTIENYRRNNKPYFYNKDSITNILNNVTEGYSQYIILAAYHFKNDSAAIIIEDNPPWIHLEYISTSKHYSDCWFYRKCINPCNIVFSSEESSCINPTIIIEADSSAPGSTYNWKILITNKYKQSDTIKVSTTVIPYPDSLRCP